MARRPRRGAGWGLRGALLVALALTSGCSVLDPEPWDERLAELERNRAVWADRGPSSYVYTLTRDCFCGLAGELDVTVVDGIVVGARRVDAGASAPVPSDQLQWIETVDDLFETVQRAIERGAYAFEVAYHPQLGHPVLIDLDPVENAVDDELTVTARELAPR